MVLRHTTAVERNTSPSVDHYLKCGVFAVYATYRSYIGTRYLATVTEPVYN